MSPELKLKLRKAVLPAAGAVLLALASYVGISESDLLGTVCPAAEPITQGPAQK